MATTSIQSPLKIALCQLSVGADKDANIAHAAEAIETASSSAQLIVSSKIDLVIFSALFLTLA
jgi:predicted amidohydrolase